jgi:hypothetical protein
MIRIHRRHVVVLVFLALMLGTASYGGTGKAADNEAKSSAQEAKPPDSTVAVKDKWQQGTACVAQNAPDCPAANRGECRTGRADGCSHDDCTAAKGNAQANLRNVVPKSCHKYIQSTKLCENGPGCRGEDKAKSDK